jgi:prophage maintenance system killer protein
MRVAKGPIETETKCTASIVCELFLAINGYELTATDEDTNGVFIQPAAGNRSVGQLADWILANGRREN